MQIFSPFYVPYTPTPNCTPTYLSPPPSMPFFMMGGFGQSCMNNFNYFVNQQNQNQNGSGSNNGNQNEWNCYFKDD